MVNQVKNLPWIAIRDVGFLARKHLATKQRPRRPHLAVPLSADELQDRLMNYHFREGWFMSYHCHGEKYNLCRAEMTRYEKMEEEDEEQSLTEKTKKWLKGLW